MAREKNVKTWEQTRKKKKRKRGRWWGEPVLTRRLTVFVGDPTTRSKGRKTEKVLGEGELKGGISMIPGPFPASCNSHSACGRGQGKRPGRVSMGLRWTGKKFRLGGDCDSTTTQIDGGGGLTTIGGESALSPSRTKVPAAIAPQGGKKRNSIFPTKRQPTNGNKDRKVPPVECNSPRGDLGRPRHHKQWWGRAQSGAGGT